MSCICKADRTTHSMGCPSYGLPKEPAKQERCGERAEPLIPRWGQYWACVLPKGHEGEHRGGGNCFTHGEYVGVKGCPVCFPRGAEQGLPRFPYWEETYELHKREGIMMGEALQRVVEKALARAASRQGKGLEARTDQCGKCVIHFIAREGSYFPCALAKGHEGDCRASGECVTHGKYLGEPHKPPQCPKWPECAEASLRQSQGEAGTQQCVGYPDCDGDLVAEAHSPKCPLYDETAWKEQEKSLASLQQAYDKSDVDAAPISQDGLTRTPNELGQDERPVTPSQTVPCGSTVGQQPAPSFHAYAEYARQLGFDVGDGDWQDLSEVVVGLLRAGNARAQDGLKALEEAAQLAFNQAGQREYPASVEFDDLGKQILTLKEKKQ